MGGRAGVIAGEPTAGQATVAPLLGELRYGRELALLL
jgi:hypothetical protein